MGEFKNEIINELTKFLDEDTSKEEQDLKSIRSFLSTELKNLEDEERIKRQQNMYHERKDYIDRCFVIKPYEVSNAYHELKAFKILSIVNSSSGCDYAVCLALEQTPCTTSVSRRQFKLWAHDSSRVNSSLTIELYNEVSLTEFEELKLNYLRDIECMK